MIVVVGGLQLTVEGRAGRGSAGKIGPVARVQLVERRLGRIEGCVPCSVKGCRHCYVLAKVLVYCSGTGYKVDFGLLKNHGLHTVSRRTDLNARISFKAVSAVMDVCGQCVGGAVE